MPPTNSQSNTARLAEPPDLLPRRFAPRSLRSDLPASASDRAEIVPTAVPDSEDVVPRWVGRCVPHLPGSTLGHNRRCTLRVACERRRTCGESRTPPVDCRGRTAVPYSGGGHDTGRCNPARVTPALAERGLRALHRTS